MNDFRRRSKCLKTLLATSVAMGVSFSAYGQNLSVENNQVTVTNGAGFGPVLIALNSNGLVGDITNLPAIGVQAFPSFSFNLEASGVTPGTYVFNGGIVISDDQSMRQLEVYIPGVTMTFTSNGGATVLAGSVAAGNITVKGRNSDGTISATVQYPNSLATFSGNNLTFNANEQINAIVNPANVTAGGNLLADLVTTFTSNSSGFYQYAVVLKQTSANADTLVFGQDALSASFQNFGCVGPATSVFEIDSSALASNFTNGVGLQGRFSIAGATGTQSASPAPFTGDCPGVAAPAPTTPTTPPVVVPPTVTEAEQEITNIVIPTTGAGAETTTAVETAVANAVTAANAVATSAAPVAAATVTSIVNTLTTGINATNQATTAGATISESTVTNTLSTAASVLSKVNPTTATTAEKEAVASAAQSIISSVSTSVATTKSLASTQAIVESVGAILRTTADLGIALPADLIATATGLSESATSGALVEIAAQSGVQTTASTAAERAALLAANNSILQDVLGVSVKAGGNTVDQTAASNTATAGGVSTANLPALQSLISQSVDPNGVTVGTTNAGTVTQNAVGGSSSSTDPITGAINVVSTAGTSKVTVTDIRLAGPSVPNGQSTLPNGTRVNVENGIAVTVAPAPNDPIAIINLAQDAGLGFNLGPTGTIEATDPATPNNKFSGSFNFKPAQTAVLGSGKFVVTPPPAGTEADPTAVLTMEFPNGVVQEIVPAADPTLLVALKGLGLQTTTDLDTGVITIVVGGSGVRVRPSYNVTTTLTAAQSALLTARGGVAAFESGQFNSTDTVLDYRLITPTTVQEFYGLP